MATQRGYQMGLACWQTHEELGLVSCQQPTYRYNVVVMNMLLS
ncbi:hypothetical protein [Escherichia coli]